MNNLNVHASVLTHAAPAANYRGESTDNRVVLQKLTIGDEEHAVVGAESIRNAIREQFARMELPCNRSRVHDAEQLAVAFKGFPDAKLYADDFIFGFMVADPKASKSMADAGLPAKRNSVLHMNSAVALVPYRHEVMMHQSPLSVPMAGQEKAPFQNSKTSALINEEVLVTAFQYSFGIDFRRCGEGSSPKWGRALLHAIGELSNVAGNHARHLFPFGPRSLVARLTPRLVPGYNSYGFNVDGQFPELTRVGDPDDELPASEFYIAGEVARTMPEAEYTRLKSAGAHLFKGTDAALAAIAKAALP